MDGKMLARLGAVVFVSLAITATAIEMTRTETPPDREPARAAESARDPLREDQRRCQQLGQAAASDAHCMRIWAESRDRFLGRAPASAAQPPEGQ
ncbi:MULTISPECIES: putative entry exclusion protein TrbK-alt [Sphingomonas]|jgi:conjugative transfer region protein TrbK|uniref:Conjugative transfer region protein TrbK n=1 Tax=Sphingomonas pseudosanguinis TaxID=413712 RepID=A0A7W6AAG1_9SPHN|nr:MULTISPECIES: putative entry exclusion protein TrbK-alt [Sphingomonas]MBB3880234.1 conjugative transfer region protein TrbK [Sphingomonas pseudosanguinis]MBN3535578.1 putative entry exclusion protein TrbK-alt [Sphingomonas pseudosanguinis]PZU79791.1 MAG: conjugal transfer protein TrbK [Sphingomonas sp.]